LRPLGGGYEVFAARRFYPSFACVSISTCYNSDDKSAINEALQVGKENKNSLFFATIIKRFWLAIFFIIGVKPGRCLSMREDSKAVKLEF
jgi:hypothetical protein